MHVYGYFFFVLERGTRLLVDALPLGSHRVEEELRRSHVLVAPTCALQRLHGLEVVAELLCKRGDIMIVTYSVVLLAEEDPGLHEVIVEALCGLQQAHLDDLLGVLGELRDVLLVDLRGSVVVCVCYLDDVHHEGLRDLVGVSGAVQQRADVRVGGAHEVLLHPLLVELGELAEAGQWLHLHVAHLLLLLLGLAGLLLEREPLHAEADTFLGLLAGQRLFDDSEWLQVDGRGAG